MTPMLQYCEPRFVGPRFVGRRSRVSIAKIMFLETRQL